MRQEIMLRRLDTDVKPFEIVQIHFGRPVYLVCFSLIQLSPSCKDLLNVT